MTSEVGGVGSARGLISESYLVDWMRRPLRSIRYITRSRPEFPAGCPEWKIVPTLMQIIFGFSRRAGAIISQEASQIPDKYLVVQWPRVGRMAIDPLGEKTE